MTTYTHGRDVGPEYDGRVRLAGWSTFEDCGIAQRLFGEMVKLAFPLIEHYHSDLYHDAMWIAKHVHGPMTFYFGADEWGTAIGTAPEYVKQMRTHMWSVELVCVQNLHKAGSAIAEGEWYVTFTPLP